MRWYVYDNCQGMPPELAMALFGIKPRIIGFALERELIPNCFGTRCKLHVYLWKYYRLFAWVRH